MIAVNAAQRRLSIKLLPITHPECWAVLLCFAAWCWIINRALLDGGAGGLCGTAILAHGGMSMEMMPARDAATWLLKGREAMLHWLTMTCAMMLPALWGSLRLVAGRSLWRRRNRAMILVFAGYAIPWIIAGSAAELAAVYLPPDFVSRAIAGSLLVAALWQLTSIKKRSLYRCHLEPLIAPSGWKADLGCVRYGTALAGRCGVSCWALMLACMAGHHALWVVAVISAIIWMERRRPERRIVGAVALAALACAVLLQAKPGVF